MANPLIRNVAQQATAQNVPPNPMQYMGQFMQNPVGALRQAGYSIPDGLTDPRQIVDHLINNGQLNQGRLAQLQNMARMIGHR